MLYAKRRDSCFAQSVAQVWLFDNCTKNKLVSAQWLHLSASTEDLFSEGASWIIPPPNLTIKTGRRIIKRGGWRAVKTFWSRDGEGGLGFGCGRCRLEQGTGLQMQASLSYHWGDLFFFRSPRKRSSACPWRRTDKVALKRMGWVALEELDKVALKGMDDN